MNWLGPPSSRANRRLFVTAVLIVAFLCVATPVLASAYTGQGATQSITDPDTTQVTQAPCGGQCQLPVSLSVASIFPFSTERVTPTPTNREIIEISDDRADALFKTLGSRTAREILAQLMQEPRTASELTEEMDTSLQNIHYHLKKLDDAGAIEEVAVEYSSRGREMSVYAATCRPQILAYDLE